MLAEVRCAGDEGLQRDHLGAAWRWLTEREPEPFLVEEQVTGLSGSRRLRLTDAGRSHYAEHWEAYARLYSQVNAPRPDGEAFWPAEVDRALEDMRAECGRLRQRLQETRDEAARLTEAAAHVVDVPDGRGAVARLARDRNKAAAAYDAALARAAARYRTTLQEQAVELSALYRQACIRYGLAATAVVHAVTGGGDPVKALEVDAGTVAGWPWTPDPPRTGLPEVDASLERAHQVATLPAAPSKTAMSRAAARRPRLGMPEPQPAVEPEASRLSTFAWKLENLVADGKLTRLLMRSTH
ncbi:hypothetical protein [Nonomuraea sp. NPDC049646]|uniref:hypothetical protein n=1 Tax=unclassified Nonomuraea TaxID=2593643 RepID=UPI0037ACD8EE